MPYGFVRISRSVLVNSAVVEGIKPRGSGEYLLRITGGSEYPVTRTYKDNLRSLAALWIGSGIEDTTDVDAGPVLIIRPESSVEN